MTDCPCRALGERQCLGPPSVAEHRNFLERLRVAAERVKEAARAGQPRQVIAENIIREIRAAQAVVRRVSFLQHRATASQASQYRASLAKLERELMKAVLRLP
jgi:hypothetical protein